MTTFQSTDKKASSSSTSSVYDSTNPHENVLCFSIPSPSVQYVDDPFDNPSDRPSSSSTSPSRSHDGLNLYKTNLNSPKTSTKASVKLQKDNLGFEANLSDQNQTMKDPLTQLPCDPPVDDILTSPIKLPSDVTCFRNESIANRKSCLRISASGISSATSSPLSTITDLIAHQTSDSNQLSDDVTKQSALKLLNESMSIFVLPENMPDKPSINAAFDTILNLLRDANANNMSLEGHLLGPIFKAIDSHPRDEMLHMRTTLFLSTVTERSAILSKKLALPAGINHLITLLQIHQKHPVIQSRVLATLTPVCRNPEAFPAFAQLKGVELIVWCLDNFRTLRPIVTHASTILRLVCQHAPENRTRIARVGALSALSAALTRWTVMPQVQALAIASITSIVSTCRTNQWIAGHAMTVEPIISAMRKSPHDIFFQIVAGECISALCEHEFSNRIRVFDADFLSVAIDALGLFGEDVTLARTFLTALFHSTCENTNRQNIYAKAGSITVITQVAQLHRTHTEISICVARCLREALSSAECREEFAICNGMDLLIETLLENTSRIQIIQESLHTLAVGLQNCVESAKRLNLLNGLNIIVEIMGSYVECAIVQKYSCQALANATSSVPIPFSASTSMTIDTVAMAMMGHRENANIQQNACTLMLNLTRAADSLSRMRQAGIVDILEISRQYHVDNEVLQQKADAVIQFVCTGGTVWQQVERISGSIYDRLISKPDATADGKT